MFFRQNTRIEASALDALHRWLKQGPSQARVDAVRETNDASEPQIPAPGEFVVR